MTLAQEKLGRALVRALLELGFKAAVAAGLGGPHVAVWHPLGPSGRASRQGRETGIERLLVARVALSDDGAEVDYVLPVYRGAIARTVERVLRRQA